MPAASANKRARQRANKLSQKESALSTLVPPAATSVEIKSLPPLPATATSTFSASTETATPSPWPAPAPATFSISYIPLSITYPEPENPAAKLPTDAVRVTQAELALMLRQSYIHGSEHGWKANMAYAKEYLQADFDRDMRDATAKFEIHEKQIRSHEFERGFSGGRDAAIHDESERQEAIKSLYTNHGTQTESPEPENPIRINVSTQTKALTPKIIFPLPEPEPPSISPLPLCSDSPLSIPVSNFLSSLFEPFEPTILPILNSPISIINSDPPSPLPPPFLWSEEPSEVPDLLPLPPPPPLVPVFSTPLPTRDFSDLCSGVNPWRSLQHRKRRDRRRSAQPIRQRERQRPPHTTNHHSNIRLTHIPCTPFRTMPYKPPPNRPAPLDWHADPDFSS